MTNTSHLRLTEVWFHRSVMFFCILFLLLSGVVSGAEDNPRKVVRVPYNSFDRLMELDEDGNPISGYAYEYIDTIGIYAGWDIQYIP